MAELVMPRLSDTMEEGTIVRWLKSDGDEVARGDELVEIETDKATMTYESDQAGVLTIVAREGETLAVGEVIARVGEPAQERDEEPPPGGAVAGAASFAQRGDGRPGATAAPQPGRSQPAVPAASGSPGTPASAPAPGSPGDPVPASAPGSPGAPASSAGGPRVKASPLARRMAREGGVDLAALSGSGPGGRIVRADVEGAEATARGAVAARESANSAHAEAATGAQGATDVPGATAAPAAADASGATTPPPDGQGLEGVATAKGQTTDVELSRTQQTIARRMAESKATIPDFPLTLDVNMEDCVALRAELKRLSQRDVAGDEPLKTPTYNDMVVKACALALREHPTANGSYRDGRLRLHSRVNVGVAVAAEDALVVPTVFDADEKSLGEIARETRALAERVRSGAITPPELGGGTFTVSNLGMYGVRSFAAIVNPPQAAILSVGEVAQRAVVSEGAIVARHTMTLTLVSDHRILYGAQAALFLARVRVLLQTPTALTL
jgi:pyruvate dehydrogenase E2 component (dihydrolipoamide acetyltransferase)